MGCCFYDPNADDATIGSRIVITISFRRVGNARPYYAVRDGERLILGSGRVNDIVNWLSVLRFGYSKSRVREAARAARNSVTPVPIDTQRQEAMK